MRSIVNSRPVSEIDRMFDLMDWVPMGRSFAPSGLSVPMDVYEQDGSIKVRASVAGVKPEDLQLTFEDDVLTLTGEIRNDHEQKDGNRVYHREHAYGRFTRSIRLPENIDENKIDAQFENGVVTITIPRTQQQEQKPRQVQIRQGSNQGAQALANVQANQDQSQSDGDKQPMSGAGTKEEAQSG